MPSREQTIADAVDIFERAIYPSGLNPGTVWLGMYQVLLWCEPIGCLGFDHLPHIIDADKLRPNSPAKKLIWTKPKAWQERAHALGIHLANSLGCSFEILPVMTDLLMKQPAYEGMQRQNTLGIAFAGIIKHILVKYGSQALKYDCEVGAGAVFPGINVSGRSTNPRIDVLAGLDGVPRVVVSTKWSLRHDRLSDISNECPVYKAAYQRIYRQSRHKEMLYYVVTNEYDPSRLFKLLDDKCVDGVVHVHKSAVVQICGLNGRLNDMIDLEDFMMAAASW